MRPELFDHVDDAISAGGGAESMYARITTMPDDGCISTVQFIADLASEVSAVMDDEYGAIQDELMSLSDGIYGVLDGVADLIEETKEKLKQTLHSTL